MLEESNGGYQNRGKTRMKPMISCEWIPPPAYTREPPFLLYSIIPSAARYASAPNVAVAL